MRKLGHFFMVIFFHLKIVFNIFQVLLNVFSSLSKKQKVNISLLTAFKRDGATKLLYKTEGVFFAYVFNYGFIDNPEGEIDMLFTSKKVKVLFVGIKPCFKTIEVNQEAFEMPLKMKTTFNYRVQQKTEPKLIHQLKFKPLKITEQHD